MSAGGAALAGAPATGNGIPSLGWTLRESFTDGAHLLLGSLAVAWISGDAGQAVMQPFSGDLFKGLLAFFLLDMGLLVARHFDAARRQSPVLIGYALLGPLVHAALALSLALAFGLSLGVTFPMNLVARIPLHTTPAQRSGAPLSDLQNAHGVAYCGRK